MFSSLIYFNSKYCYDLIRQVFALPCAKTVEDFTSLMLKDINESLFNVNKIENILNVMNINFDHVIECILACDAAVFSPITGAVIKEKLKIISDFINDEILFTSIFTFMVQTLDPGFSSFPVNVIIKTNGFADESIDIRRIEIIDKLKKYNMNFKFQSTDGDKHFDRNHDEEFQECKTLIEKGASFDEIVETVDKHESEDPWWLNDPLHLLKNILNTIIGICYTLKRKQTKLSRLGTYKVECFYGGVKINCHFDHTLFKVLHSISKSILAAHFIDKLVLKTDIWNEKHWRQNNWFSKR